MTQAQITSVLQRSLTIYILEFSFVFLILI